MRNKKVVLVLVGILSSLAINSIKTEAGTRAGIITAVQPVIQQDTADENDTAVAGIVQAFQEAREKSPEVTKPTKKKKTKKEPRLEIERNHVDVVSTDTGKKFTPKKRYPLDEIGYVDSGVGLNVRDYPNIDKSEIVGALAYIDKIEYTSLDEEYSDWAVIKFNNEYCYISKKYITDTEPFSIYTMAGGVVRDVTIWGDGRKSFMDYRTITDQSSKQYLLQQYAYTGLYGVRVVDGRFLIAVGSGVSHNIGTYADVVLSDGTIIPAMIGEAKKDVDSYNNHTLGNDGGAVEFIVQTSALSQSVRNSGNLCSEDEWGANVVSIRLYDRNFLQ